MKIYPTFEEDYAKARTALMVMALISIAISVHTIYGVQSRKRKKRNASK